MTTDGTVTALKVGQAVITATCGNVSATCAVTVEPTLASEIILNFAQLVLKAGQSQQLTASVPEDTTETEGNEEPAPARTGIFTRLGSRITNWFNSPSEDESELE